MIAAATASTSETTRRNRRIRRVGLGAVVLATLALSLSACGLEQDLTDQINGSRAAAGARGLVPNATITFKAAGWAQHLANIGTLVHSSLPDGNNLQWR